MRIVSSDPALRTALALSAAGELTLTELSHAVDAPPSAVQRALEILLDDGVIERTDRPRPLPSQPELGGRTGGSSCCRRRAAGGGDLHRGSRQPGNRVRRKGGSDPRNSFLRAPARSSSPTWLVSSRGLQSPATLRSSTRLNSKPAIRQRASQGSKEVFEVVLAPMVLVAGRLISEGVMVRVGMRGYMCYAMSMDSFVSVRELRNKVSEVLRRVEGGERVTVTVDRRPVAELVPLRRRRARPVGEALSIASRQSADRGFLAELRTQLPDTTDDL